MTKTTVWHVAYSDEGFSQSKIWGLAREIDNQKDHRFGRVVARLIRWWKRNKKGWTENSIRTNSFKEALKRIGLGDFWYDGTGMLGDNWLDVTAETAETAREKAIANREKLMEWLNLEIPDNPWVKPCAGL